MDTPRKNIVQLLDPVILFLKKNYLWFLGILIVLVLVAFTLILTKTFKIGSKSESKDSQESINSSMLSSLQALKVSRHIDPINPPKFIQADFVELDKVYAISKFRSGMGHDYSYLSGETCRSMKHYFTSIDPIQPNYKYEGYLVEDYPKPTIEKDVKIFAPVDGTINIVETEVVVVPDIYPNARIRLQHVTPAPGITAGQKVKAGEIVGFVLANQSFDLAIEDDATNSLGEKKTNYYSYFSLLPDNLFAKYEARGVKSRDELIITKEYRDAHPYSCHGKEVFDEYYLQKEPPEANRVFLSGFKEMEEMTQKKYPNPNIVKTRDTDTYSD